MAELGRVNRLTVTGQLAQGWCLDGEQFGEVMLPTRAAPQACQIGDQLEVFLYVDAQDRVAASAEAALASVGEFAWLKVLEVNEVGAFLDWGLPKDLLLPYGEQKYPPEVGKRVMVKVMLHERTDRLIASTRIDSFVQEETDELRNGQAVDLLIADKTELGYKAIVNNAYWGVLYSSELYQTLSKGQRLQGFVKYIRPDKKIDLTLTQPGYGKISSLAEQIVATLQQHDGFLMLTDKSSPEAIRGVFKVSKKAYKQAVGALYKQRRIAIEDKGIRLLDE
jgi:predicted RNA-binding protein (virulence factor B family)